ncbi:MAG: single-stranded DNA-binding protein [Asticcacaulis sp.]|uniref:single-stranded DNA-binding protein n=1 Tax=Asticcacaulis sp. TaxID=1872648 RepID=UPI003F7B4AF0
MNNTVTLIGRLGEKPVCRTLNDGARLATLSLATDDGYKGRDGEWVKRTTWHRITVWGDKRVDYIEKNYGKGDLIQFMGQLRYSQSERDGVKYHNAELTGSTSLLAQAHHDGQSEPKAAAKSKRAKRDEPRTDLDDEIPF